MFLFDKYGTVCVQVTGESNRHRCFIGCWHSALDNCLAKHDSKLKYVGRIPDKKDVVH